VKLIYQSSLQPADIYKKKTYYFKAMGEELVLPKAVVKDSLTFTIPSKRVRANILNPPDNFCNVLAKDLNVMNFESVQYSKNKNLVVMKIVTHLGNLEDFSLRDSLKEEVKSIKRDFPKTQIIYYTILPNTLHKLTFSYFNLKKKEFETKSFKIRVKDESVSTQSDIKPSQDKNRKIKMAIFIGLGIVLLAGALLKKSFFTALLALASLGYGLYMLMPMKKVCVKEGAKILILPTQKSTVFKINTNKRVYEELGRANGYVKIKLSKEKIGWIKDEDSCKN